MIPGLEIHQLIDDHVLQDKLVDVFDEKLDNMVTNIITNQENHIKIKN
jgi:hypothetical protein